MSTVLFYLFFTIGVTVTASAVGLFLLFQWAKFLARAELRRKERVRLTDLVRQPSP